MQTLTHDTTLRHIPVQASRLSRTLVTGRILSGLTVAFLLFDAVGKLLEVQPVIDGTLALGYPRDAVFTLGVVLFVSVLLYALPRTAVFGAILLTGYLGGAVATHVRVGNPLFTHILFPTYIGALCWGGLALRDARQRVLLWQDMFAARGEGTRGGRDE